MRNAVRVTLLFVSIAFTFAQPPGKRLACGMPWPSDVSTRRESVFLDRDNAELVIVVRSPDGQVSRTFRTALHNQVAPSVTATVSKDAQGFFHYAYSVANGKTARMPIRRWTIGIDEDYKDTRLTHPRWRGGPGAATGYQSPHHVMQWLSPAAEPLAPGQLLSGFEVISDLAPGYVDANFYGRASRPTLSLADRKTLPEPIAAELKECSGPEWDSYAVSVVGPRFTKYAAWDRLESDFHGALFLRRMHQRAQGGPPPEGPVELLLDRSLESGVRVGVPQIQDLMRTASADDVQALTALGMALENVRHEK